MTKQDKIIVGIDIGATKTKMGYLEDGVMKTFFHDLTAQDPDEAAQVYIGAIRKAKLPFTLAGIGIGCPGPLDQRKGIIKSPPNLLNWNNFPLKKILESEFNVPVFLENDANTGALGEALYGKAKDYDRVFYMTISSGIGTGIVIDKKIYQGFSGLAGEIWAFDPNLFLGKKGLYNVNDLGAGNGFEKQLRDSLTRGRSTTIDLNEPTAKSIIRACEQGDELAMKIVEQAVVTLSAALCFVIYLLAPDIVVLGGGLCTEPKWIVEPLVKKIRQQLIIDELKNIPIERARLWNEAVLYGAVSLVKENEND